MCWEAKILEQPLAHIKLWVRLLETSVSGKALIVKTLKFFQPDHTSPVLWWEMCPCCFPLRTPPSILLS